MKTKSEIIKMIAPIFSVELDSLQGRLTVLYGGLRDKLAALPYEKWCQEIIMFDSKNLIPAVNRFCENLGNIVPNKCAELGLIPQNRKREFWTYSVNDLPVPIPSNISHDLQSPDSASGSEKNKISPAGIASLISGAGLSAANGVLLKSSKTNSTVARDVGIVLIIAGAIKIIYDALKNNLGKKEKDLINKNAEILDKAFGESTKSVISDVSDWMKHVTENAANFIYKIQDED